MIMRWSRWVAVLLVLAATAVAATAVAAMAVAAPARAEEGGRLRMLTWSEYLDPDIVRLFEQKTGCEVKASLVATNEDYTVKLAHGGADFDVISPSSDLTSIMIKLGLVEPLNTSWLGHWSDVEEVFRRHPGITVGGQTWAVPFTWSAVSLAYRTDKFADPPSSWSVLWDWRLEGRIALWDDKSSIYLAARLILGDEVDVFDLSDAELATVTQKLIEQKPLIRKYWISAGELVSLYTAGDVWVSDAWDAVIPVLREQGIPVERRTPKERATGWLDAWQIVRESPNTDCAYAWLNFVISPEGQCASHRANGFAGVNRKALESCLSPEAFQALGFDEVEKVEFWREPRGVDRYIASWNAVKAAQ